MQRLQHGAIFRGCRHSFMFRPPSLLATQVAPTDTSITVWPPWRLLPNLEEFVSSLFVGYANRPNRAIDGRGLSPHSTHRLVGCSHSASRNIGKRVFVQDTPAGRQAGGTLREMLSWRIARYRFSMNSRVFGQGNLSEAKCFCLSVPPRQTKKSFLRDLCVCGESTQVSALINTSQVYRSCS